MADQPQHEFFMLSRIESGIPRLLSVMVPPLETRKTRTFVVTALIPFKAQQNGLPANGQLGKAMDIEEKLEAALRPFDALHVGHITHNGNMRVVFYTSKPTPTSITIKTGLLSKQTISLDCREDPEWDFFETELKPTETEADQQRTGAVLRILAEKGDAAGKERPVDFAARFPSAQQRSEFIESIASEGFLPSAQPYWEPAEDDFWCEITKSMTVEPQDIFEATNYLRDQAEKHGGDYDGWQSPITP